MVFVDLENAYEYDRIPRYMIYGGSLKEDYINAVEHIHERSKTNVRTLTGCAKEFRIDVDPRSPSMAGVTSVPFHCQGRISTRTMERCLRERLVDANETVTLGDETLPSKNTLQYIGSIFAAEGVT